ncbi:hypothetical protein IEO21_00631 [Rhodonia placenta]|uniref:MARVEL domain-containing protein n=1 Tax=Rhodonia placenta TaxID=104341 RepID=A0A8H7PBF6_9APHY|nr:hypothetical protein IEO21_00631 [Postia placenta]
MLNPFLAVRLTILLTLGLFNVFLLIIAAFNVAGAVNAAAVLVIFNACCTMLYCFTLGLAQRSWSPKVILEFVWAFVSCMLQLVAAGLATLNCSIARKAGATDFTPRGSSFELAIVAWLSTWTFWVYTFALLVSAIAHATHYPTIWATRVTAVPWFTTQQAPVQAGRSKDLEGGAYENPAFKADDALSRSYSDTKTFVAQFTREDPPAPKGLVISAPLRQSTGSPTQPKWARTNTCRGRDDPFPTSHAVTSRWSVSTTRVSSAPPPPPPKAFGRLFGQSAQPDNGNDAFTASAYSLPSIGHSDRISFGIFPDNNTLNTDVPIPAGDRSEWVAATDASSSSRGRPPAGRRLL